jgi:hypothetical protein
MSTYVDFMSSPAMSNSIRSPFQRGPWEIRRTQSRGSTQPDEFFRPAIERVLRGGAAPAAQDQRDAEITGTVGSVVIAASAGARSISPIYRPARPGGRRAIAQGRTRGQNAFWRSVASGTRWAPWVWRIYRGIPLPPDGVLRKRATRLG